MGYNGYLEVRRGQDRAENPEYRGHGLLFLLVRMGLVTKLNVDILLLWIVFKQSGKHQ